MVNLDEIHNRLLGSNTLVYDVETDGLDWTKNRIAGYVLTFSADPADSFYLPVRHSSANLDAKQVERVLADGFARSPLLRVIGHNLKFDLHFSLNQGITIPGPLECTQVNAALIDENAGRFSLEACAQRAGVQAKKGEPLYAHLAEKFGGEPVRRQMEHFSKLAGDDPIGVDYALGDGTSTWQLWEHQQKEIDAQELRRVWAVECRVLRTLYRMERFGVRVDEERLAVVEAEVRARLEQAVSILPDGLNIRSTPQLEKFFLDAGIKDYPTTEKGNASFTEKWLVTNERGRAVVAVRKLTNLQSSFLTPLKERHIVKGRVHCNFNQLKQDEYGTVTGRLSCDSPNLQACPKRDKVLAPIFRSLFVPEEGCFWSSNDFKSQEFVVFTEYTQNQRLVEGYAAEPPIDIHQNVADMLGVERDPTAKRMNLGMVYGMGVNKLAYSLGIPVSMARAYRARYDAEIPEARQFLREAETRAKERGWVKTKLGRRRHFPDSRFAHKAGNSVIQGTSADITKVKMADIDEYFASQGDQCHLQLQIHDELTWSAPNNEPGRAMDELAVKMMEDFSEGQQIYLKTRMRVDHGTGSTWTEATFG